MKNKFLRMDLNKVVNLYKNNKITCSVLQLFLKIAIKIDWIIFISIIEESKSKLLLLLFEFNIIFVKFLFINYKSKKGSLY